MAHHGHGYYGEEQQGHGAPGYAGYGGYGRGGSAYGREERPNYGDDYGRHGSQGNYDGYQQGGHHAPSYGDVDSSRYQEHQPPPLAAQTSQTTEGQQLFKIYCEANPDYLITVKPDGVVLAPGDESNQHQQFTKDCKWGSRVQDEAGSPAFAIINKATGLALKHGREAYDKVTVQPYNPDVLDESVLWTQSADVGNGYQCLRPVGNTHLNLDANHGDHAIRSGTELILFKWKKQENQKWKIFPISKTASSYESYGQGTGQSYGQRHEPHETYGQGPHGSSYGQGTHESYGPQGYGTSYGHGRGRMEY